MFLWFFSHYFFQSWIFQNKACIEIRKRNPIHIHPLWGWIFFFASRHCFKSSHESISFPFLITNNNLFYKFSNDKITYFHLFYNHRFHKIFIFKSKSVSLFPFLLSFLLFVYLFCFLCLFACLLIPPPSQVEVYEVRGGRWSLRQRGSPGHLEDLEGVIFGEGGGMDDSPLIAGTALAAQGGTNVWGMRGGWEGDERGMRGG